MNRSTLTNQEIRLLYEGGAKCERIGELAGVSETAIRKRLHRMGVRLRNRQDYPATMAAAHSARRGSTDPMARREARAQTRERLQRGVSRFEDDLAAALDGAGVRYVRQKAIGPYNVDFLIDDWVVELSGGGHNPRVRANWQARCDYLVRRGLTVCVFHPARDPDWLMHAVRAITSRR